jgi:hypothetical protein
MNQEEIERHEGRMREAKEIITEGKKKRAKERCANAGEPRY